MNCAQYVANFLRARRVSHVFGLPGGENVPMLEALRDAGIEFVLVHHEATAGFAADVTGQLTERPGVCLATVGPGAVNLLGTTIGATLERSPVIAITADIDSTVHHRVTHMKADLTGLFGLGAKASIRISADSVSDAIRRAWALAMEPPRGAVHVSLAPDTAIQQVPEQVRSNRPADPSLEATVEQRAEIRDQAREMLRLAKRPFLLVGPGLEAARAQPALLALAEAWQAPVAVTPKAKGHFPESHYLFAGCFTAYGDLPLRRELRAADIVLGVGLDGVDLVTSRWEIETPLVSVTAVAAADPVFRPKAVILGELTTSLNRLRGLRVSPGDGATWASQIRNDIEDVLAPPMKGTVGTTAGTVQIDVLISALRAALDPAGVVTLDVGAFKLVFLQRWHTDLPKTLFVANGLSAMGYALPGALAVKLAQPDRPVIAVVGDGALLMYAGELATISRMDLPIVILVVVDQALALIRLKQMRQEVPPFGTEFASPDYRMLATAFNLDYRLIASSDDAVDVLRQAFGLSRPVLVEARIDKAEYDHFR